MISWETAQVLKVDMWVKFLKLMTKGIKKKEKFNNKMKFEKLKYDGKISLNLGKDVILTCTL